MRHIIDMQATFDRIRSNRDCLNKIDDELAQVIELMEKALHAVRPGVRVDAPYKVERDGIVEEQWLSFQKLNGTWRILHSFTEDGAQTALVSAPREVRAHVFEAQGDDFSPMESFMLEVADSLAEYANERSAALMRARALSEAVLALGFIPVS